MIPLLMLLNLLNHLALLTAYYDVIIILMSHDSSEKIRIVALDDIQMLHIQKAYKIHKSVDLEN